MAKFVTAMLLLTIISMASLDALADEASDAGLPSFPPKSSSVQRGANQVRCGATHNGVDVERWMTSQDCSAWIAEIQSQPKSPPSPSRQAGRNPNGIPLRCNSQELVSDVRNNLPDLLNLGPGAATITGVSPLMDSPIVMPFPPIGGSPARYSLYCQVQVHFSNGLVKYGAFREYQDEYGQVMVRFGG